MVQIYANEAEQMEHLKKLWEDYGVAILVGILVAILIGFGWRYLQNRQEHTLEHASIRYEQLLTNVVNSNSYTVETQANRLIERYPHTPYAEFAALQLARQYVYQGRLAEAETKLRWVMKHGDNSAMRAVARIRLARVLLGDNQAKQALDIINDMHDKAYAAAADEVKGDILLALNKPDEARTAYENALKAFPGFDVIQPLLQMKVDDLATTVNTGS